MDLPTETPKVSPGPNHNSFHQKTKHQTNNPEKTPLLQPAPFRRLLCSVLEASKGSDGRQIDLARAACWWIDTHKEIYVLLSHAMMWKFQRWSACFRKFKCTHDFGTFIHFYGYLEGLLAPLFRQKLKQLPWLLALSARLCRSSTLPPFSLSTGLALALPNATGHTLHVLLSDPNMNGNCTRTI